MSAHTIDDNAHKVAPARERGLKYASSKKSWAYHIVAPARERGLKSAAWLEYTYDVDGRSREGAWIEI